MSNTRKIKKKKKLSNEAKHMLAAQFCIEELIEAGYIDDIEGTEEITLLTDEGRKTYLKLKEQGFDPDPELMMKMTVGLLGENAVIKLNKEKLEG